MVIGICIKLATYFLIASPVVEELYKVMYFFRWWVNHLQLPVMLVYSSFHKLACSLNEDLKLVCNEIIMYV